MSVAYDFSRFLLMRCHGFCVCETMIVAYVMVCVMMDPLHWLSHLLLLLLSDLRLFTHLLLLAHLFLLPTCSYSLATETRNIDLCNHSRAKTTLFKIWGFRFHQVLFVLFVFFVFVVECFRWWLLATIWDWSGSYFGSTWQRKVGKIAFRDGTEKWV